jgi:para-nitrobenzyl esterase
LLDENVRVTDGLIVGNTRDAVGILAFKGIPFAAAPIGPLRWREPEAVAPRRQPRSAKAFGPRCWQTKVFGVASIPGTASEDCLYLNVWTGARSAGERRRVMVWIHGGGFLLGTASTDISTAGVSPRRVLLSSR